MAKLTLTQGQRAAFFDDQAPSITGEGDCPVERGYVYRLSERLSFKVLRIDTGHGIKDGKVRKTWQLHYLILDKRDPHRLIRRTPAITSGDFDRMRRDRDEYGYPHVVSEGEAAELSGYTNGGKSAIEDAGEAPPRGWVEERAKQCRLRDLSATENPKREAQRLREAWNKASAKGLDVSDSLARIRQEIDGMLERVA